MSQRREYQPQYFHPRNPNAYWREAVEREMAKLEAATPGIFSQPAQQQTVSQ